MFDAIFCSRACVPLVSRYCWFGVPECATNNGGCAAVSQCVNNFGGFTCRPYLVPGSLTSPSPLWSSSPLVFGSIHGGVLRVQIGAPAQTPADWMLVVNTTTPTVCPLGSAAFGPPTTIASTVVRVSPVLVVSDALAHMALLID